MTITTSFLVDKIESVKEQRQGWGPLGTILFPYSFPSWKTWRRRSYNELSSWLCVSCQLRLIKFILRINWTPVSVSWTIKNADSIFIRADTGRTPLTRSRSAKKNKDNNWKIQKGATIPKRVIQHWYDGGPTFLCSKVIKKDNLNHGNMMQKIVT